MYIKKYLFHYLSSLSWQKMNERKRQKTVVNRCEIVKESGRDRKTKTETLQKKIRQKKNKNIETEPASPAPELLLTGLLVQQRWHLSHVYVTT